MTLEEMKCYCEKAAPKTNDEVMAVHSIYCILDFDKQDFCKLVDAIGLEKWVEAKDRWERIAKAVDELGAKERYFRDILALSMAQDRVRELSESIKEHEMHVRREYQL